MYKLYIFETLSIMYKQNVLNLMENFNTGCLKDFMGRLGCGFKANYAQVGSLPSGRAGVSKR